MIEERYRLAVDRIGEMRSEQTVQATFTDYFHKMAEFAMMIAEISCQKEFIGTGARRNLQGRTGDCMRIFCRAPMREVMRIRRMLSAYWETSTDRY